MNRLITAVSALAVACAAPALADTLTWTGGASGSLSAAASWTSDGTHATPQPGDTVMFATPSAIALPAETFDLGASGLTVSVAQGVTVENAVSFSGAGVLVKEGTGNLRMAVEGAYTGGTTISDGQVTLCCAGNVLGTGTVTIARGEGRAPNLTLETNHTDFNNPIALTGPCLTANNDISVNANAYLKGPVTSEGSLTLRHVYNWESTYNMSAHVHCPITVTDGGTLYATAGPLWLASEQNCSVGVLSMWGNSSKDGRSFGINLADGYVNVTADAVITNAVRGHVWFYEGSRFEGREVVVKGSSVTLVLAATEPFGDATAVKVLDGATVQANAITKVPRLFVGGTEIAAGTYTADDFPASGTLTGSGTVVVGGTLGNVSTWKGGALGSWTDEKNWDNGVPSDGQVAIFNSETVVNEGEVSIGEGGLTVICNAKVTIATNAAFTGVGKLTKKGDANLAFAGMNGFNTHSGGTDICGGLLVIDYVASADKAPGLGTGLVTITRTAGQECALWLNQGNALTNDVLITGPYTASTVADQYYSLCFDNGARLTGKITAEGDFKIRDKWLRARMGDIDAHGHTVYCYQNHNMTPVEFLGDVDASYVKGPGASGLTYVTGRFTDPDASFTLLGGTNDVAAAASVACRNIVVSNASAGVLLRLNGAGNLSREAKVSLWKGGRLEVAKGVRCAIAELWADGVRQPDGRYSSSGVPAGATVSAACFEGKGRVRVGETGAALVVR